MTKWVEVAKEFSQVRFEVLSQYLNDKGYPNQIDFMEADPSNLALVLEEAKQKYDLIRVGSPHAHAVLTHFTKLSDSSRLLGVADTILKNADGWNLRSMTYLGLNKILAQKGTKMDIKSAVMIVGAGSGARLACAAFSRIGFRKFTITNKDVAEGQQFIDEMKRYYYGLEFTFVPQEKLILLPGSHVVAVNTTPLKPENDLLYDLYYFNFLQPTGLVFDFTIVPADTPLIQEAQQIGIEVVRGFEVSSWGDMEFAASCFGPGPSLSREEYCERLLDRISKTNFDFTPYYQASAEVEES